MNWQYLRVICHSRESGNPSPKTSAVALDPRLRAAFAGVTGNAVI